MPEENYPLHVPQVVAGDRPNLVAQLDPASIAELLVHQFKGEVWMPHKQKWENLDKEHKLMNDKGIRDIVSLFSFFFNQNSVLSNLTDRQIATKVETFGESVGELMALSWRDYEVDKTSRTAICLSVVDIVDNALKRSLVGQGSKIITDKALLDSTQRSHIQEIISDQHKEKKKGILHSIFK
jgi:hypothetical protein